MQALAELVVQDKYLDAFNIRRETADPGNITFYLDAAQIDSIDDLEEGDCLTVSYESPSSVAAPPTPAALARAARMFLSKCFILRV